MRFQRSFFILKQTGVKTFSYPKKVRLRSKKLIAELFENNQSFSKYPLRMVWKQVDTLPEEVPIQTGVSVSKKRFKRAVNRNLLKRRMREAVRLNIQSLNNTVKTKNIKLAIMFIYTANEIKNYNEIENSLKELLQKLENKIAAQIL